MKIQTSHIAGWAAVSMQWGAWAGSGMAVTHNLLPRIIKSGAPFSWHQHVILPSYCNFVRC